MISVLFVAGSYSFCIYDFLKEDKDAQREARAFCGNKTNFAETTQEWRHNRRLCIAVRRNLLYKEDEHVNQGTLLLLIQKSTRFDEETKHMFMGYVHSCHYWTTCNNLYCRKERR